MPHQRVSRTSQRSSAKDDMENICKTETYPNHAMFMRMMRELEVTPQPHKTDETNFSRTQGLRLRTMEDASLTLESLSDQDLN